MEVCQHIHGRFDEALYNIFRATNTIDMQIKLDCLTCAKQCIFFQFTSFEYLVKVHALSAGSVNVVLLVLKDCYEQASK